MTAYNLAVWATILGPYLEGRLSARAGPSLADFDYRGLLNLAYATLVDMLTPSTGNGVAAMQKVDEILAKPPWPTEDEWLDSSDADEGQQAMMEMFGPAPALPRGDLGDGELIEEV